MKLQVQLARTAHRIWNKKGCISTLLLPLSWLTGLIVQRKSARYRRNPERVWQSPVPVVIVGNIYVGGTGKTPVVMALVDALKQRGWHPGVVSRGYGVDVGEHPRTGTGNLEASRFGDEPALIARNTQAPVAVHPSRPKAAQALLRAYPEVDVIVADDGLQHLALGRDAEIIVQDTRKTGNGRLLPAGPLREPASRLSAVDVIVTNETSVTATNVTGPSGPLYVSMTLQPHEVMHISTGRKLPWATWMATYADATVGAVAAIGHPERFFNMLTDHGLKLEQTLGLPDHTAYDAASFDGIRTDIILITSKDAVKCAALNDGRLWAVHVNPEFSNHRWLDQLHDTLQGAARRKTAQHVAHSTLN